MVDGQYPDIRRYRFGTVAFDEARFELHVDGAPVKIPPKPARLLQILLRHHDQLVTREQLRQVIWDGADITYDALNMAKSRLDDCLGPDNAARIVTRPRLGYCLTGPVESEMLGIHVGGRPVLHDLPSDNLRVRPLLNFITDALIDPANPAVTGRSEAAVKVRIRGAAARIDAVIPEGDAYSRQVLHRQMQGLFSQLAEFDHAIRHGRAALLAAASRGPTDPQDLVDIQLTLASDLIQQSKLGEADDLIAASDRLIEGAALRRGPQQVRLLLLRGRLAIGGLDVREAVGHLDQAAILAHSLAGHDPDLEEQVVFELAHACWLADDYGRAEPVVRSLMAGQAARFGAESARAAYSAVLLANILAYADRCDEATALLEPAVDTLADTLGPDDRRTVMGRNAQANIAFKQRHYAKAAAAWRQLKAHFTRLTGPASLNALVNDNNIAIALHRDGRKAEAGQIIGETLAAARGVFGEEAPLTQLLKYELGDLLLDAGKVAEAAPLLADLDPARLKEAKIQDDWPGVLLYQQGRIAHQRGDRRRALALLGQAAAMLADSREGGPIGEADVRALIRQIEQEDEQEE
jgi:DNA-binding winged helix-turn-helix (wHTH) protein